MKYAGSWEDAGKQLWTNYETFSRTRPEWAISTKVETEILEATCYRLCRELIEPDLSKVSVYCPDLNVNDLHEIELVISNGPESSFAQTRKLKVRGWSQALHEHAEFRDHSGLDVTPELSDVLADEVALEIHIEIGRFIQKTEMKITAFGLYLPPYLSATHPTLRENFSIDRRFLIRSALLV